MAEPIAAAPIPTGFAALDGALRVGGLPRGSIIELFGPAGCGKTTLAIQIVAHAQRQGFTAAWIDAEHVFDPAYAASLNLALDKLPVLQPAAAEDGLEIARQLVNSGAMDFIVVDSAAALVPHLELESTVGEAGPGVQQRVLASGLRRLERTVRQAGTCLLFVNQTRTRRDAGGEDSETAAGGAPLRLHAAVRIALYPVTPRQAAFRILKNKAAAAFAAGELEWRQGAGFAETA